MSELLPPWKLEAIEACWNQYSRPLNLRSFSYGKSGSRSKACRRLTTILRDNATLLGCRPDDDIEGICDVFETTLQLALIAMQQSGLETVNERLNAQYEITLGFWQFLRPDIKNIVSISDGVLQRTPVILKAEADAKRAKAKAIKQFKSDCDDYISAVLRQSGSDQVKLQAALKLASHRLALLADDLRA